MTLRGHLPRLIGCAAGLAALASPAAALDESVRPRGAAVVVSDAAESRQRDPDVVVDAEGRALVVWTREIVGGYRIEGRLAERGLDFAGPVLNLSGANASWMGPRVALRDGGFLVMWNDAFPSDPEEYATPVLARRVSAAGVPIDEPFVVTEASLCNGPIALAAVPGGTGYVALWAWPQTPAEPDELYLAGRRLSADGTPAGPVFPVAYVTAPSMIEYLIYADVDADTDGSFVAAWTRHYCFSNCYGFGFASSFGPDGSPRGSEVFFEPTSDDSVARGVRAVAPGTFVVAWTDFDHYGTDLAERSLATAIGADGSVLAGPTPITEPGPRLVSAHLDIDDGTLLFAGRDPDQGVGGVVVTPRSPSSRPSRSATHGPACSSPYGSPPRPGEASWWCGRNGRLQRALRETCSRASWDPRGVCRSSRTASRRATPAPGRSASRARPAPERHSRLRPIGTSENLPTAAALHGVIVYHRRRPSISAVREIFHV